MNDRNTMKSKKGLAFKIIVPIILVCMVIGVWALKNKKDNDIRSSENTDNSSLVKDNNSDFALNVTKKIDLEKLKSYKVPIVIDFGSDSCKPCQQMAPILKDLNTELRGKAIIRFVDVWKDQSLADGYPITSIPTQIFIDANGNPFKPKDPEALKMTIHESNAGKHLFTSHLGPLTKPNLMNVLEEMGMK